MKWGELLQQLDAARVELRQRHGKELDKEIPEGDTLAQSIQQDVALAPAPSAPEPTPLDSLLACAPSDPVPEHKIQDVIYRGDGEGRMVILKRDTPLILREPDLEEVTEEELAK